MSDEYTSAGKWVVGTDGSVRGDKAVMWAAHHASERTVPVPLLILHCIPEAPEPSAAQQDEISDDLGHKDAARVEAEQTLAEVVARVRDAYPDAVLETAVVRKHPALALTEAGIDADQVIVGGRGSKAPALAKFFGGTSDHVVANAEGTVVVVPDQAEHRPEGEVVLGVSDSDWGRLAKARAFQAASLRGVPLVAIVGWGKGAGPHVPTSEEDARAVAEKLLAPKIAEFPQVEVKIQPHHGRPEDAIVEASRTAGLIVLGSRGEGGFAGLRLGPTTRRVLRETRCPVVVTRAAAGWQDRTGRPVPAAH